MPRFNIETDEDEYRLCGDDEYGSIVPYGETSVLVLGESIYYTTMVESDAESAHVYLVREVKDMGEAETQDVEFRDSGVAVIDSDDDEETV
jgi:hypothetical protein